MNRSVIGLKEIIKLGGGINIDASLFTIINLKDFARLGAESGARIILRNTTELTLINLNDIARLGKGRVLFQF
jgi:hypothetical protein